MPDEKKTVECPGCHSLLEIMETEDGLSCIPFEGPEAGLLTGYTRMRNGAVRYIGPNAVTYSREEALAKFGAEEVAFQDAKMKENAGRVVKLGKW